MKKMGNAKAKALAPARARLICFEIVVEALFGHGHRQEHGQGIHKRIKKLINYLYYDRLFIKKI